MEHELNQAPFPLLEWDDYCWSGSLVLPVWTGFQARGGAYAGADATSPSKSEGTCALNVASPEDEPGAPTPEQAATYEFLQNEQQKIQSAILDSLLQKYPQWQEQYGYDEEEARQWMPDVADETEFRPLLGLSSVHIHCAAKDGLAYVGFLFGCTWDDEHGFGAMMHGARVVKIGGADTAILEWIAQSDAQPESS